MQASSALRKEEATEAGRELRALLRLLTNLTQRDLLDFGSSPDGPKVDVAQVWHLSTHYLVLLHAFMVCLPSACRLPWAVHYHHAGK